MELTEVYRTEEERIAFLKGIIRLARADKVITDEERVFFKNLATGLAISLENVISLEQVLDADMTDPDVKAYLKISFAEKPQAIFFLENALQLCYLDGTYHEKEQAEIKTLARELGLAESTLDAIDDWVQEGMAWQAKGERLLFLES